MAALFIFKKITYQNKSRHNTKNKTIIILTITTTTKQNTKIHIRKLSMRDNNTFEKLNKLNELLVNMDDRGLVLTLAAFAEESLGHALAAYMLKNKSSTKLLDGFNAPLGTLSSRIQAAHALGIVTEDQYQDLEHLRKVRNHFSHTWKLVNLDSPPASDHIDAMCYSHFDDTYPANRKEKLRSSASALLLEVQVTTNQIIEKNNGAKIIGSRVITYAQGESKAATAKCINRIKEIDANIASSTGAELDFHKMLRDRWIDKLELVAVLAAPDERLVLIDKLKNMRNK
jgi:DNA-binding MltR family transcriptional regulator